MSKLWIKQAPWLRTAQQAPQAPAQTPPPPASLAPNPAPISAQPQPTPQKVNAPHTLDGCKVTIDGHNLVIESPSIPPISISLSAEQQNAVGARLKQKRPVAQQPSSAPAPSAPPTQDPVMQV